MVIINAPIGGDKIVNVLDGQTFDNVTFTYKGKKGMALQFETNMEDSAAASLIAKAAVKAQPFAAALHMQFTHK